MFKIFSPLLKRVYSLSSSFFVLLPFSSLFFLAACSPNSDTFFQKMRPASGVKLTELLDEVPVLEDMFSNINQGIFNKKLASFLAYDTETSIFMLNQLYHLIRVENHLPKLLDDASGVLRLVLDHYQDESNSAELDRLSVAFDHFSEAEFKTFFKTSRNLLLKMGKALAFIGNNSHLFPDDPPDEPFASSSVWSDCSISDESFQKEKPSSLSDKRNTIYEFYELSRTFYCTLDKLLEDDFQDLFAKEGGHIQTGLADLISLARSLDVEGAVKDFIHLMNNRRDEVIDIDREMSEWLVSSPGKVGLLDYAINHLYLLLASEDRVDLFRDGTELLGKGAPFLTTLNPEPSDTENKYLAEWLVTALDSDLDKIADLTSHTNLDLENPLYNKASDLLSPSSGSGLKNVFNDEGGYLRSDLKRFFNSERFTFVAGNTNADTSHFQGLFYDNGNTNTADDGPLKVFAHAGDGTNYGVSPFRGAMNSRLSSVLKVPLDYRNESPLEGFLNNFYYHVLDQYYSFSDRAWKVSRRKNGKQTLPVYLSRLQYSLFNLMSMNANAEHVTPAGNSASAAELSERVPYMTHFFHTLAGAMGYLDVQRGPAKQTLETSLRAVGNDDVADDGIQTASRYGQTVHTGVICKPEQEYRTDSGDSQSAVCNKVLVDAITRNGEYYMPTSGMPAYELLTPGAFFTRNSYSDAQKDATAYETLASPNPPSSLTSRYKGRFSVHQGDLVSTDGHTAEWAMSQFQFFGWYGYGPFTVRGKAPNGSRLKYANTFITDSYRSKICAGVHANSRMYTHRCHSHSSRTKMYPLGNNGSNIDWASPSRSKEGAVLMYENIYRPEKLGDPCWEDSGGPQHGHARYGYLRPSKSATHQNNSLCANWKKIQVDFNSREQAIAQNIRWLIYHKKFVLITPNYTYSNYRVSFFRTSHGASVALFSIAVGNGLQGFVSAKLAGTGNCRDEDSSSHQGKHRCNGTWNSEPDYNMMDSSNDTGKIPVHTSGNQNGFKSHTSHTLVTGGTLRNLISFGRTSFKPGDFALIVDYAVEAWGGGGGIGNNSDEDVARLTFANIPRPTTDFAKALAPLLSMGKAYSEERCCGIGSGSSKLF